MSYKVTPWYPGNVKPMPDRPGVYQRKVGGKQSRNRGIAYAYWSGVQWSLYSYSITQAAREHVVSGLQARYPWRGVVFDDRMSRTRPETLGDW